MQFNKKKIEGLKGKFPPIWLSAEVHDGDGCLPIAGTSFPVPLFPGETSRRGPWERECTLPSLIKLDNTTRNSPKEGIWITTLLEFLMRGQLSLNSYKCKKINYNYIFKKSTTFQNGKTREKDVPLLLF